MKERWSSFEKLYVHTYVSLRSFAPKRQTELIRVPCSSVSASVTIGVPLLQFSFFFFFFFFLKKLSRSRLKVDERNSCGLMAERSFGTPFVLRKLFLFTGRIVNFIKIQWDCRNDGSLTLFKVRLPNFYIPSGISYSKRIKEE